MKEASLTSHQTPDPLPFALAWISAWNRRDVESVLASYDDNVVFSSPTAQRVVPESRGTVSGKASLRRYWTLAMDSNPDLHFSLLGVYAGVDTIVLHYRNQVDAQVCEALTFHRGRVVIGAATHHRG